MSNNIIVTENFKNISQICPIKKIQYYNSETILIVQTNDILEILLFFKNHFLFCKEIKISIASLGFDFPPVFFINSPIKNPASPFFPEVNSDHF